MTDWSWLLARPTPNTYCLTFVYGMAPAELIRKFGMHSETAEELTPEEASTELVGETRWPWMRIGEFNGWAFAIEDGHTEGLRLGGELSDNTQALVIVYVSEKALGHVAYYVDAELVTSFEPMAAYQRSGADPDRFVDAMREAGLPMEPDQEPDVDPDLAALRAFEVALGIGLPDEAEHGRLLTAEWIPPWLRD
ncbi:DUF6461 domain-containing protein [Kutzneria buriramensis]|uniref:Uncharacterized protein n=1 Tax=Kutzneria buriramensis TaxID=1045776 RepID=A0A3E0H2G5_9PSEU|nr:DUF6461 domain-containing protein [Kutzneria buriramensis]REH36172.1 hypothetical protein BCF44_11641 [Kutzneria buriramensis]